MASRQARCQDLTTRTDVPPFIFNMPFYFTCFVWTALSIFYHAATDFNKVPQFGSKDPLDSLAGGKITIIHVNFFLQ